MAKNIHQEMVARHSKTISDYMEAWGDDIPTADLEAVWKLARSLEQHAYDALDIAHHSERLEPLKTSAEREF